MGVQQKLLRHADIKTTMNVYAIVSQADIAEALGRLELRDGHSLGHSETTEGNPDEPATV